MLGALPSPGSGALLGLSREQQASFLVWRVLGAVSRVPVLCTLDREASLADAGPQGTPRTRGSEGTSS